MIKSKALVVGYNKGISKRKGTPYFIGHLGFPLFEGADGAGYSAETCFLDNEDDYNALVKAGVGKIVDVQYMTFENKFGKNEIKVASIE